MVAMERPKRNKLTGVEDVQRAFERVCRTWHNLLTEMSDPAFELTTEEFAVVSSTFAELDRLAAIVGEHLDPGTRTLITVLRRQTIKSDEFDADGTDEAFGDDGFFQFEPPGGRPHSRAAELKRDARTAKQLEAWL